MRRDVMEMEKEMEKNAFCDACLLFSDTCEQPLLQTLYTLPLREWYTRVVIDSRARRRQQHTHTHTHTRKGTLHACMCTVVVVVELKK